MNLKFVDKIAKTILYEGYLLYPYRASSVKNRQRFNFGVLTPQSYSLAQNNTEKWSMVTECLALNRSQACLSVKVRFLHLQTREVSQWANSLANPLASTAAMDNKVEEFLPVELLEVNGEIYQTWQEAIEREVTIDKLDLNQLGAVPQQIMFSFSQQQQDELLHDAANQIAGRIVRKQQQIDGSIVIQAEHLQNNLLKIKVAVFNQTPFAEANEKSRNEALACSLVSTHTIMGLQDGEFISMLETPPEFQCFVTNCQNIGTWPVLVGEAGERDLMLSSPIILYDYPQTAQESTGDLYDSTEIDEILTLRILTLTEEEKREMRYVDDRARQILERTEALPAEQFSKLHGVLRGLRGTE